MSARIETDLSLFNNGMIQLKSAIMGGSRAGMQEAMEDFLDACFTIPPTVPVKSGEMRKAHRIKVLSVPDGVIGELTVEGIRQAASLHEGISRWGTPYKKWTTPGSGSHWISSKLLMFRKSFVQRIAAGIKRAFRMVKVRGHFKAFGTVYVPSHFRRIKIR